MLTHIRSMSDRCFSHSARLCAILRPTIGAMISSASKGPDCGSLSGKPASFTTCAAADGRVPSVKVLEPNRKRAGKFWRHHFSPSIRFLRGGFVGRCGLLDSRCC